MKLSIYTSVKNGLFFDFHVVEMLRHHLPLADEIIVNEGYSKDGTYEAIANLDPKVKVFRSHWGKPDTFDWFLQFKNEARRRCTGDWSILLDCDEFIPEWEFERIRESIATTKKAALPLKFVNFYGNYKVFHQAPEKVNWPNWKMVIHRNLPDFEVWGDGSNVRPHGATVIREPDAEEIACHHFGFVRNAARLREKWRNVQGNLHSGKRKWFNIPSLFFNWRPHNWLDPLLMPDLAVYEGPNIAAVRENPAEFVRDDFVLDRHLASNRQIVSV